jgi:hypothetical protein
MPGYSTVAIGYLRCFREAAAKSFLPDAGTAR